jgi:Zn-finger nucleic acid-binding protein
VMNVLKKLLKYGLEYAFRRYQSRSYRKPYGGYDSYGYGYPGKRYYKKRKRKSKLFDLFD